MSRSTPKRSPFFDAWLAATDDPLRLVTGRDNEQWEGWGAMRARAHARLGHATEALPLLGELAAFAPHKGYLTWLPLIRNVGQVPDETAQRTSHALLRFAGTLTQPLATGDPARPSVDAALALLAEWRETKRGLPEPLHALSILLRKLGRTGEALAAARTLFELRPDWRSAGTLSSTLRAAGDLEAALEMAKRGAELTAPELRAANFLDVGDLSLELNRPSEARQAYSAALELEQDNAWGRAGFFYASFREHGNEADRAALRSFVVEHPDDRHACQLLGAIGEPLLDKAVWPSDATAAAFRQIHQSCLENPPSAPLKMSVAVSAPEGPSNTLAGEVSARAFGQRLELELSVTTIPTPDPREPLPGAELALWRRAGGSFEAALDPPDPAVQREVGILAATPYNLAIWMERARILGEALGPARVGELLATMVHPPPLPHRHFDPPLWIQNVQIAAAAAIAHVDRGWQGSVRRASLLSIGRGPVDWSVTAAIVVLMWISMHEPRSRAEIEALFQDLRRRESRAAGCTYDVPLRQAWLRIPGIAPETRAMLQGELSALLSDGETPSPISEPDPDPLPAKVGSGRVTAAAWALGLSGVFLVPRIWPAAWGDWSLGPSMACVGLGFWIWARQVRSRPRS